MGPMIPTQALAPKDRFWYRDRQATYPAEDNIEWLRQHGKGLFPFFL
jgi:hypothetical protein